MKLDSIVNEIQKHKSAGVPIDYRLVHSGMHYDKKCLVILQGVEHSQPAFQLRRRQNDCI